MTQNVLDYSQNPSGADLMDTFLAGMAENQLTNHSGVSRPSYAQAGTFWIDISTSPWTLKQFTGTTDISIGTLNQTTNVFVASRALGDKNGNDIATTYLTTSGTAARATQDADGNTISSTYAKKGSANTFTANNTFSGNRTVFDGTDVVVQADTDFSGSSNRFGNLVLKKNSLNTVTGGAIKFQANTSDPTQYDCSITRINGTLRFGGTKSSGNPSTPFIADIENEDVWFSLKASKTVAGMAMPKYSSSVSISNTGSYTAPTNGYAIITITGGGSETLAYINSVVVARGWYTNTGVGARVFIPMRVGDVLTWDSTRVDLPVFVPCYGG